MLTSDEVYRKISWKEGSRARRGIRFELPVRQKLQEREARREEGSIGWLQTCTRSRKAGDIRPTRRIRKSLVCDSVQKSFCVAMEVG